MLDYLELNDNMSEKIIEEYIITHARANFKNSSFQEVKEIKQRKTCDLTHIKFAPVIYMKRKWRYYSYELIYLF